MIDDIEYVRKDSIQEKAVNVEGLKYCLIRCSRSGVFAGYLKSRVKQEGVILSARRIWYWTGAASISQLAVEGTSSPDSCKFPCIVDILEVTDILEVIPCTIIAQRSIEEVSIWKQ